MIRRSGMIKRSPLKRFGPMAEKWQKYRNERAEQDQNEEGLIRCQDHLLGLNPCGISRGPSAMDLHHVKGREEAPKLYFADSNNIWLTRECHDEAHDNR